MKLRAIAAVATVCSGLLLADVVQRLVIAPWVRLRPERRIAVLGRWQQLMASFVLSSARTIGGASIPPPPVGLSAGPGQLILMNHQSLFDIPLVVQTFADGYPRIVTRTRYSRSIPLISHMVRLYQYPTVDSSANRKELRRTLQSLGRVGRESDLPIVLFPEGARTSTGEIGRFKSAGLTQLLAARPWTVHVFVVDGFWKASRFSDLTAHMGDIDGRSCYAGTLEWTDAEADPSDFIKEARALMIDGLHRLRYGRDAA